MELEVDIPFREPVNKGFTGPCKRLRITSTTAWMENVSAAIQQDHHSIREQPVRLVGIWKDEITVLSTVLAYLSLPIVVN